MGPRRARATVLSFAAAVAAALALASALAGCHYLPRPSTVPLRIVREPPTCPVRPDTLLVMLPGSYSLPEDFGDEGFVAAARARGIAADLWLVDAHRGYYGDRTILERLRADVIEPARSAGYRRIWFVGISIGAYGALQYARLHPGQIDGIVAIGPYLGERETIAAIEAAGGLARWRPPTSLAPESDAALWAWLQRIAPAGEPDRGPIGPVDPRAVRPTLWLGYGADDRFAAGDRLLAAALPPGQVQVAPGGHDWAPWRVTWDRTLDATPWPRDPACRSAPEVPAALR